ncbi:MAG: cytochrome c-type biogenesis protein [Alphaproteobacteria bacterium]
MLAFLLPFLVLSPAAAVNPDEKLPDPALEARALEISRGLRCVVCQNQSIDDSNAELARDMRLVVRRRVVAGDNDAQVTQFMVDRYGDFVTLRPPLKSFTLLLWFGPSLLMLAALWLGRRFYHRRADNIPAPAPLSDEERRRLEALLKDPR